MTDQLIILCAWTCWVIQRQTSSDYRLQGVISATSHCFNVGSVIQCVNCFQKFPGQLLEQRSESFNNDLSQIGGSWSHFWECLGTSPLTCSSDGSHTLPFLATLWWSSPLCAMYRLADTPCILFWKYLEKDGKNSVTTNLDLRGTSKSNETMSSTI